jgi:TrmH family RNA methyltransferase
VITSAQNPKIQWVRALQAKGRQRRAEGVCVIEGVRLAEEALASGWPVRLALLGENLTPRAAALADTLTGSGAPLERVSDRVLASAADTQTPQGVLLVLEVPTLPLPPQLDFVFLPDRLRDPGNLGTMLRTAAAAGVQAVLLPPETVDPFAPKVLRAAMGAHFRLPLRLLSWPEIGELAAQHALTVYLADAGGGSAHTAADLRRPLLLVIGGEADGASPELRALAHVPIHIPMPGGSESLNAAAAAAILLFETVRQRENP